MSAHANAEILLAWLGEHAVATVSEIAASGLMSSRTASDAIQYALRNGALERIARTGVSAKERVRYRLTGIALPVPRTQGQPSFDGLLEAWGIALKPIHLAMVNSWTHQVSDSVQEEE
ncbi:hypothetical protein E1N52_41710 [Paraburkholderia guartelaensis]|uniref:Uncharacterized protein n=1 Tax=Paraburkholderia guartelaensis TaxID=2546446 RepID=A0A4R5L201_9BURK|nr:hypothetical protein [Paraburkholderia guartelaensis]TDG02072.1 hypothetical protein E1N52_41710 [Paraburkholderia guartelaensis]